jgi:hypothetical protein
MTRRHDKNGPDSRPHAGPSGEESLAAGAPESPFRRRLPRVSLLLAAAALLSPSLLYPFARDQGVFAYAGSVILKGGWPYRNVWDLKPPGIYYAYAAMLACTGSRMFGVRAIDLAVAVGAVGLLFHTLRRLQNADAAWLGGLLYAACYLRLGFWGMAQAESYANVCTALALFAWLRAGDISLEANQAAAPPASGSFVPDQEPSPGMPSPRPGSAGILHASDPACGQDARAPRRRIGPRPSRSSGPELGPVTTKLGSSEGAGSHLWSSAAAGISAAGAVLFKVTALPPLVAALAAVSLLRAGRGHRRAEVRGLVLFAGGFVGLLVVTTGVMALSGAGAAYLEIQRGFVRGYVAMAPEGPGVAADGWHYFWRLYAAPVALAGVGLWAARAPARLLLGAWLAAALISVTMQRKYFGYHWTPVLLPLAGLAGTGLAALLSPLRRLPRGAAWAVAGTGALLIAGWSAEREANGYGAAARLVTGRLSPESYWSRFGRPYQGDFSFLADVWAARYIQAHTRPSDGVYLWGFEPLTLFLAGRYAPSRFIFAVPLVSPWTPARWREELMRDLTARPPILFGVMRHDPIPHASGRRDDSAAQLVTFPALRTFLHKNYRYETTIEDLTLYRRETASDRRPCSPLKTGQWPSP